MIREKKKRKKSLRDINDRLCNNMKQNILHKNKYDRFPLFGDIVECSFKFILKVGVEESIVSLQSKNTNNAKSEVRFKHLIRDL
jgi:hypothetical protein